MAAPSYEEFRNLVKQDCRTHDFLKDLSEEELEEYLSREDSTREIKSSYESDLEKFKNGEITEQIFRMGCVYAVSNCLFLMYDDEYETIYK